MTEDKYILLKGDLSGIQEYIFNIQSDGAAKTLKARSIYIDLLLQLCANLCEEKLKIQGINVEHIYCGGGNFFFMLETSCPGESIISIQESINNEFLHDEIALVLTISPLHNSDFGEDWLELLKQSNTNKLSKYKNNSQLFLPYSNEIADKDNIRKRFSEYHGKYSDNILFTEITNCLVKSSFIETSLSNQDIVLKDEELVDKFINKLPFWKNYPDFDDYKKYRTEDIPKDTSLIDFDGYGDFSAHRTGTNKLGVLKMDVDNLGGIFRDEVKSKEQAVSLSNRFKKFYEETLYKLWDTDLYHSDIYPVFAGGDDCYIIGSWDRILLFARDINEKFKEFFSNKYTLSAGLIFVHPKHPVYSFTQLVNDALDRAKQDRNFDEIVKDIKHNKNSICLFNEVLNWDEYNKIIDIINDKQNGETIIDQIQSGKLNRSFIDKIRNSAKGFCALQNKILETGQIDIPKLWRLKYYISRKAKAGTSDESVIKFIEKYEEALLNALLKKNASNPAIFPIAARIIEMATRKKLIYESNNEE